MDSLAKDVDWNNFSNPYCFPPFPLIQQVLDKILKQKIKRLILIAPWWSGKPFFPCMLSMIQEVRRIPVSSKMIIDMATGAPPPDLRRLKLVVAVVSGTCTDLKEISSQPLHQSLSRLPGENKPRRVMELPGPSGSSGVPSMNYHHLRPL